MSKIVLDFSKPFDLTERKEFGAKSAIKYKQSGFILLSIYTGKDSIHALLDAKIANKMMELTCIKTKVITFAIGGKTIKALIQNIAFHPVTGAIDYIEFISCEGKSEVSVLVPISIVGKSVSPGVKRNGKINIIKYEVPVVANINKIPEQIVVDISKFGLGKTYNSSEVEIDGVRINGDFPILSIVGRGKKDLEDEAKEAAAAAATPAAK